MALALPSFQWQDMIKTCSSHHPTGFSLGQVPGLSNLSKHRRHAAPSLAREDAPDHHAIGSHEFLDGVLWPSGRQQHEDHEDHEAAYSMEKHGMDSS